MQISDLTWKIRTKYRAGSAQELGGKDKNTAGVDNWYAVFLTDRKRI